MKTVALLSLLLILLTSITEESYAQEFSVGVYPPIIQATTLPPTVIKPKITISNKTESEIVLDIQLKPFRPTGRGDGSIVYPPSSSLVENLIFPQVKIFEGENEISKVNLSPSQSKELILQIDINNDTPLSDYYFSVVFITEGQNAQENITIPAGIATNVLLTVGQNASKEIKVELFKTPKLQFSNPVPFTLLLKNSGENVITPSGSITIQNMFGKDIDSVKILPEYIVSESTRFMTEEDYASRSASYMEKVNKIDHNVVLYSKRALFGKYEAILNGYLLENSNTTYTGKIIFYVLPIPYLSAGILVLLILIIIWRYTRVRNKLKSNSTGEKK